MGDYTPVHLPGLTFTMAAAAPVTAGDVLEVAGSGLVAKMTVPGARRYVGVAGNDAAVAALVTVVAARPVHEGAAEGAVTAGDEVAASAAPGRQVVSVPAPAADLGAGYDQAASSAAVNTALAAARAVIGVALTTAADGATVRWMQRLNGRRKSSGEQARPLVRQGVLAPRRHGRRVIGAGRVLLAGEGADRPLLVVHLDPGLPGPGGETADSFVA